jgi:DNA (cytosine-5)-methyltransferase 1
VIEIDFIEIHKDHVRIQEATKQGYAIGVEGDSVNLEQPNSKTRRGRVGHQVAQTLTCSCNQGVIINNIEINKSIKGLNMNKNKIISLVKHQFNMEEVKLFDSFAGIGALHHSLKELGVPVKVIGLSETDVDATISYAGGHINNFKDLEFEYPSENEMRQLLIDRNIGWDFIKQKSCIPRLKKDKLYKVYKATILLNNLGDISKLDYNNLPNFDLFNFSFPCTDLSNAGKQKGLKNEDGSPTRSGLVKYGIEVIKAKKPKYIMIENVKALIQKKFIDDFYDIINELKEMGYRCYYPTKEDKKLGQIPTCLNAKNYGIAQNRERIFVICVRNDLDEELLEFPKGFDNGLRLKDFLEDEVDEKYYLSQEIQDRFKLNGTEDKNHNELNVIGSSAPSFRTIGQRDMTYGTNGIMSTLTATDYKQPKQILDKSNNELSFLGGINDKDWIGDGKSLSRNFPQGNRVYDSKGIACSQTAQGGGIGSYTGLYKEDCNLRIRKLTPLECWRLMGFRDECFDKAKELGLSDSALYKQAGNSIVVNVLYYIFKELFKDYIVK